MAVCCLRRSRKGVDQDGRAGGEELGEAEGGEKSIFNKRKETTHRMEISFSNYITNSS